MYHIPSPGEDSLRNSSVVSIFRILLTITFRKEKNYMCICSYKQRIDIYVRMRIHIDTYVYMCEYMYGSPYTH